MQNPFSFFALCAAAGAAELQIAGDRTEPTATTEEHALINYLIGSGLTLEQTQRIMQAAESQCG